MKGLCRAVCAIWLTAGCAWAGEIQTIQKDIKYLTHFDFEGTGRVSIEQGEKNALLIRGDAASLEYTKVDVEEGRVRVVHKRSVMGGPLPPLSCTLICATLQRMTLAGDVTLETKPLKLRELSVDLHGNVQAALNLEGQDLIALIHGSCALQAVGSVEDLYVDIQGTGVFKGREMRAETAQVRITGSGKAEVFASKTLGISIKGRGDVDYWGNPSLTQRLSGTSTVTRH
jgi:hypothetical protein